MLTPGTSIFLYPHHQHHEEGYLLDLFIISMWWKWRPLSVRREEGADRERSTNACWKLIKNIPEPLFELEFLRSLGNTLHEACVYNALYKGSNALIMSSYNAWHDLMSKCNYNCNTLKYLIFTPLEMNKTHDEQPVSDKESANIILHFNFIYDYLWAITLCNVHYEYLYNAWYILMTKHSMGFSE